MADDLPEGMKPPPFAAFPSKAIRQTIPSQEWEACLDAWILLVELRLRLTAKDFSTLDSQDDSGAKFLLSYFKESNPTNSAVALSSQFRAKSERLRRVCFLLTHRMLLQLEPPPVPLLHWTFLGNLCQAFRSSRAWKEILHEVWTKSHDKVVLSLTEAKFSMAKNLSYSGSTRYPELVQAIQQLTLLSSALPQVGHVLMTGSDYLDALFVSYKDHEDRTLRKALVANTDVGLTSLLKTDPPKIIMLLDQLFSLKVSSNYQSKKSPQKANLLSDLICTTPFLSVLETSLAGSINPRGQGLLDILREYRAQSQSLYSPVSRRRKRDKGKGRATVNGLANGVHVHKMSLVSQVQDLFPDLGAGYIIKLLDEYNEDAEQVIAHLLDDSLPPYLRDLDKTTSLPFANGEEAEALTHDLAPHSTPPTLPSRHNIHDNDEFDNLAASASQIHVGWAYDSLDADALLADRSQHNSNKSAILSALAAFDSDDDERDDTYDVADVGGMVDTALPDSDNGNEEALFKAYKASPGSFGRDATTRRGKPREELKRETGMTDEAIEGWAIMLSRDSGKMRRLESKFLISAGAQPQRELAPTAYRKAAADSGTGTGTEDSEVEGGEATTRGGFGGRDGGRGRGRGRGGNVSGPANEKETQLARQRKDAHKGSRANHNRRDQRARKMARGGFGL